MIFSLILGLLFSVCVHASPTIEVVQSVPIETNLAVPKIRQTQQVWLEMISAAKKSIDFEEFYIYDQPGQALEPVLNAVRDAASRGIQVRFIVDSKFYKTYPTDPDQLSQVPNIQVKTIDFSSTDGIQHSKYFVVDQSEAFIGSANFDWLALTHIHEVGVRIANDNAQTATHLEAVFEKDWQTGQALGKNKVATATAPIALVPTTRPSSIHFVASPPSDLPTGISDSLDAIIQLLASAKNTLNIQVYEYDTKIYHSSKRWKTLDDAIRKAATKGVHVQLLVDQTALKAGRADLKALAALKNIEVRVVTIPEWSGGHIDYARLIHSKYFTVDGTTAWVGSENWSESYFTGCRNVGVILQSSDIAGKLNQIFDQVWKSGYTSGP